MLLLITAACAVSITSWELWNLDPPFRAYVLGRYYALRTFLNLRSSGHSPS